MRSGYFKARGNFDMGLIDSLDFLVGITPNRGYLLVVKASYTVRLRRGSPMSANEATRHCRLAFLCMR